MRHDLSKKIVMIQRNSLSVYANLGLGGMIVDTDEVVARAELFKGETFTAE